MEESSIETPALKSVTRVLISILVSAILAGGGVYAWQKQKNDKTIADLQSQVDTLKGQVGAAQQLTETASQKSSPPIADPSSPYVYASSKYGFTISLNEKWKRYKVIEEKPSIETLTSGETITENHFSFIVPTSGDAAGVSPFRIIITTVRDWEKLEREKKERPTPEFIAQNATYAASYITWQNVPYDDLVNIFTGSEIQAVVNSLKFTK